MIMSEMKEREKKAIGTEIATVLLSTMYSKSSVNVELSKCKLNK